MQHIDSPTALRAVLEDAGCAVRDQTACSCPLKSHDGWASVTEAHWPREQMAALGSLRDAEATEPSYAEWHPRGSRYDSADAPVAVGWFPYNRCELHRCGRCGVAVMRYTEFGGYYVDHRARRVDAGLVDDSAPAPAP